MAFEDTTRVSLISITSTLRFRMEIAMMKRARRSAATRGGNRVVRALSARTLPSNAGDNNKILQLCIATDMYAMLAPLCHRKFHCL